MCGGFTRLKGGPPVQTTTTTKEGLRNYFGQMDTLLSQCLCISCVYVSGVWICLSSHCHLATHAYAHADADMGVPGVRGCTVVWYCMWDIVGLIDKNASSQNVFSVDCLIRN